jgi:DNA-binding transcriptional MocR family regulator
VTLPPTEGSVVGGYFIWFSLPAPLDADELAVRAKEDENVIIAPGSLFGVYGDSQAGELAREVRICIAWEERELLAESIDRLGRAIGKMLVHSGGIKEGEGSLAESRNIESWK